MAHQEPETPAQSARPRFQKRSDVVAERLKRWIVDTELQPGDRLPQEKQLIDEFGVSKGTVREALKALEVQGLITVSTGPKGGARIAKVPLETAARLLDNYFFFEDLSVDDLYRLRLMVEPELAYIVAPLITDDDLEALERVVAFCDCAPVDPAVERDQRMADLDFHDILAERCPNPLIRFSCRFINSLIKKGFVYQQLFDSVDGRGKIDNMETMVTDGNRAHRALIAAFRNRDADQARALMLDHMREAYAHLRRMEVTLKGGFLDNP